MTKRKPRVGNTPLENTPFIMVDPDPNDFFTIQPNEKTIHLGTYTKLDEFLAANLIYDHPEAAEEVKLLVRRFLERGRKDWRYVLAERLMEYHDEPPSRWLLEEVAKQFAAGYGFKVEAVRRREGQRDKRREARLDHDRKMIDELAKELKAQGMRRGCRGEAKKMLADMQGVTVDALKQRRRRARQ